MFSHDRLTFTMANHLKDQKRYSTCKLLLAELERVVGEEIRLRNKLLDAGVRDVSGDIRLPKNRLDQLDEESADYDDKRLCHACKHVCFFSCVACECSQSKVSCLRHSHYMCRCPTERKYMMIWSKEEEMNAILERATSFAESLQKEGETVEGTLSIESNLDQNQKGTLASAPGAVHSWQAHKDAEVDLIAEPLPYPLARKTYPTEEKTHAQSEAQDLSQALSARGIKRAKLSTDVVRSRFATVTDGDDSSENDDIVFVEGKSQASNNI